MKRIHRIGAITGCAGLVWIGMLYALQSTRHSTAVLLAPLAAVFGLAAYMLAQLVWGVVTFRSVPEAADALQRVRVCVLGLVGVWSRRAACLRAPKLCVRCGAPALALSSYTPRKTNTLPPSASPPTMHRSRTWRASAATSKRAGSSLQTSTHAGDS
jgi:hypothetical protein